MLHPSPLPRVLFLLAVLGVFGIVPIATAEGAPSAVPTGITVQVDGRLPTAEWSDALAIPYSHPTATLYAKQFRGTAFFAFDVAEHWIEGSELVLYFAPDNPAKDIGAWTDGAVTLRYEPLDHNRPHVIVTRQEGQFTQLVRDEVVASASLSGSHASLELAFPLKLLRLGGDPAEVVRFASMWVRPGSQTGTATFPEGLDVGAQPGTPPADLAQSVNWAQLTGFTDVDKPGAYSKTDWAKWIEAQNEITRRGEAAYALYREMDEERRQYPKQDGLVNETIVEAVRWIAEREPLTTEDQLLLARAYTQTNRGREALAILDGLVGARSRGFASRALYERATTLGNLERFAECAATWRRLASMSGPQMAGQYEFEATRTEERIEAWTREQKTRAEDDTKDLPLVEISTSRGRVVVELQPEDAPKAVAHFLKLVRSGFYDGLRFHRVIGEFMAQTGSPLSRGGDCTDAGSGSSEEKIEIEENLRHGLWRGAVAFAVGMVQENGSQFFILTAPKPELMDEQVYTVFGRVVAGMDVVDRIEYCDPMHGIRVLTREAK